MRGSGFEYSPWPPGAVPGVLRFRRPGCGVGGSGSSALRLRLSSAPVTTHDPRSEQWVRGCGIFFWLCGGMESLARELVNSCKVVGRLYENRAELNSISMHLGESIATARAVGHLQKSAEVMKLVNNLMKAPQLAATMQVLSKEMMKAGIMEEMLNDELDSALDNENMEEEIEEEVDKVLESLAVETTAQLPATATRREWIRPSAQSERQPARERQEAVAEGGDHDAELDALRARLDNVRS